MRIVNFQIHISVGRTVLLVCTEEVGRRDTRLYLTYIYIYIFRYCIYLVNLSFGRDKYYNNNIVYPCKSPWKYFTRAAILLTRNPDCSLRRFIVFFSIFYLVHTLACCRRRQTFSVSAVVSSIGNDFPVNRPRVYHLSC